MLCDPFGWLASVHVSGLTLLWVYLLIGAVVASGLSVLNREFLGHQVAHIQQWQSPWLGYLLLPFVVGGCIGFVVLFWLPTMLWQQIGNACGVEEDCEDSDE